MEKWNVQRAFGNLIFGQLVEEFGSLSVINKKVGIFKVRVPVVSLKYSHGAVLSGADWRNCSVCLVKCMSRAF